MRVYQIRSPPKSKAQLEAEENLDWGEATCYAMQKSKRRGRSAAEQGMDQRKVLSHAHRIEQNITI